ncbi:MAG TPA: class I SAM-dependent methyltransferase [Kofleriaceae bacterium]|nr:class I SAM-dependent methyltransferase [Kofleriaceae bacterium]
MLPAPTAVDAPVQLDRAVCKEFWEQRALIASDPRSVTLDQQAAWTMRFEVSLYQGWLLRRLPARRMQSVVDLACGNGDWTTVLAARADRIVAVDFSEGMVAACRARLARAGHLERAELVCGDVSEVAVPTSDLVIAGAVTQYLSDERVDALLANVRAALAPGGVFYLRTTVSTTGTTQVRADATFQGVYRPKAWFDERIARAGFTVVESTTATEFVADEAARRFLGPLRPLLYYPLHTFRKIARRRKPTDVAVYLLQAR